MCPAPCHRQEFAVGGARFSMLFYVVPVAPGRSRFFAGYATDVLPPAVTVERGGGW